MKNVSKMGAIGIFVLLATIGLTTTVQAQYSEFVCEKTGEWRLSDGTIVNTPVGFDVAYMMEMFLACDYQNPFPLFA